MTDQIRLDSTLFAWFLLRKKKGETWGPAHKEAFCIMSWVMCMQCHFWEPCMQANSFNSSRRSEPSGCVCQEVIYFQPKPLEAAVVCHLCEDASPCWTCMCLAGRERRFLPTRQKALSTNSAVSPTKTSLRMLQKCLSLLSLPLINLPVLLAWPHKWLRMEINPLTFDLVLLFNHIYSCGPLQAQLYPSRALQCTFWAGDLRSPRVQRGSLLELHQEIRKLKNRRLEKAFFFHEGIQQPSSKCLKTTVLPFMQSVSPCWTSIAV